MSVTLDAYLFFPGNTEEAIAFYQGVFGGDTTITRRGDVDPAASDAEKNQVINALLTGGDITLRASDRDDTTLDSQTRVELSIIGADEPRLRAVFDGLANGGTVRTPLAKQFWGDTFGAVTDKYGIGWQVNIGAAGA
jgi:PhnB protein